MVKMVSLLLASLVVAAFQNVHAAFLRNSKSNELLSFPSLPSFNTSEFFAKANELKSSYQSPRDKMMRHFTEVSSQAASPSSEPSVVYTSGFVEVLDYPSQSCEGNPAINYIPIGVCTNTEAGSGTDDYYYGGLGSSMMKKVTVQGNVAIAKYVQYGTPDCSGSAVLTNTFTANLFTCSKSFNYPASMFIGVISTIPDFTTPGILLEQFSAAVDCSSHQFANYVTYIPAFSCQLTSVWNGQQDVLVAYEVTAVHAASGGSTSGVVVQYQQFNGPTCTGVATKEMVYVPSCAASGNFGGAIQTYGFVNVAVTGGAAFFSPSPTISPIASPTLTPTVTPTVAGNNVGYFVTQSYNYPNTICSGPINSANAYPLGQCISFSGSSVLYSNYDTVANTVSVANYQTTANCTGSVSTFTYPLNTCEGSVSFTWVPTLASLSNRPGYMTAYYDNLHACLTGTSAYQAYFTYAGSCIKSGSYSQVLTSCTSSVGMNQYSNNNCQGTPQHGYYGDVQTCSQQSVQAGYPFQYFTNICLGGF